MGMHFKIIDFWGKKKKKLISGVPFVAQWAKNLTRLHEDAGSIPGLTQRVKDSALLQAMAQVTDGSLDLALLWLWHRLAAAADSTP